MRRLIKLLENLFSALQAQSAYSDVAVGPTLGDDLDPAWSGVEVQTAGTLEIVTGEGNTVELPVETGRIYPVAIQRIESGNTSVSASDIIGYIE